MNRLSETKHAKTIKLSMKMLGFDLPEVNRIIGPDPYGFTVYEFSLISIDDDLYSLIVQGYDFFPSLKDSRVTLDMVRNTERVYSIDSTSPMSIDAGPAIITFRVQFRAE